MYSSQRHDLTGTALTEAKRIAEKDSERILILRVVGVVDRRKKKKDAAPEGE